MNIFQKVTGCLLLAFIGSQNPVIQGQDLQPLTGTWKNNNGYFFNWIDDDSGIFNFIRFQLAEDGKTVSKAIEGWATPPNQAGLSHRFVASSSGRHATAYQTFDGKELRVHWVSQGKAGHERVELSPDGNSMVANGSFDLNEQGFSMRDLGDSATSTKLPDSNERAYKNFWGLLQDEAFVMPDESETQLFDARLQPLLGRWQSARKDGSLQLEIYWRKSTLGKFLYESYKFYDELGNLTATGLNISGKDPYSDRILIWGNNAEAFTQKGGWDFVGDKTLIQREGDWRLIRDIKDSNTITGRWEQKVAGRYRKAKDSVPYTLRKLHSNQEATVAIEGFLSGFVKAFADGDLKALMKHYHKDAVKLTSRSIDPLVGKKAIAADFAPRIGEGQLKATLTRVTRLTPDHLMGCGEFQHVGSNGEVMATGQWGNVFLLEKGRWLMLQESAHLLNLGGIADAGTHSFQDIRETECSNPSTAAFTASETMARDYLQGWTNRDPEQIVNLFHHTGTRVVSAVKGVTKHHKNLRASILKDLEVNNNPSIQEAKLDAITLGATPIGGNLVMAYGKWQNKTSDGKVSQIGTWGNVMRQRGDEVKIILEAAGNYHPD